MIDKASGHLFHELMAMRWGLDVSQSNGGVSLNSRLWNNRVY